MDESEGMDALKTAYVEVILNTMKEAAARVMESEQKAGRVEQDLKTTRDESLRLLLRMKHMIDSKAAEAEISSINQQRRIDELEAQLNEAEGLVVELRAELNMVHEELDGMKKRNVRNKEAEMYGNGSARRICAVVMNSADEKLCPRDDDPRVAVNSDSIRECSETKPGVHVEAGLKVKRMVKGNVKKDRANRLRGRIKRRKICHGKAKASLRRCLKSQQSLPAATDHLNKDKTTDSCGVVGEKTQQSDAQSVVVRRSVRKRKVKYWDDAASVWRSDDSHSNPWRKAFTPCRKPKPVKSNVNSTEEQSESQTEDHLVDMPETVKEESCPTQPKLETNSKDAKRTQRRKSSLDQVDAEGRVTYTFSRKRKKESFINPEDSPGDSFKKNKQLAHVAQQLISLSGNWS